MDFHILDDEILFLPGVTLADYVPLEDRLEQFLKDELPPVQPADIVVYDRIPRQYTRDSWPASTNLRCWNCDRHFCGRPLFVPSSISIGRGGHLVMDVDVEQGGNFCHQNCAFTHICRNPAFSPTQRDNRLAMFMRLCADLELAAGPLVEVPERHRRVEYGGPMTFDEFSAHIAVTPAADPLSPAPPQLRVIDDPEPPEDTPHSGIYD